MKTYEFTVSFVPAEEGGYTVTVPALPGCISEGDTLEEAKANIKEAVQGFIEALEKDGQTIPTEKLEKLKIAV